MIAASPQMVNVWKIICSAGDAVDLLVKSGTTILGGPFILLAKGSSMSLYYDGSPHWSVPPNNDFIINLSAAVALTGQLYYTQGG